MLRGPIPTTLIQSAEVLFYKEYSRKIDIASPRVPCGKFVPSVGIGSGKFSYHRLDFWVLPSCKNGGIFNVVIVICSKDEGGSSVESSATLCKSQLRRDLRCYLGSEGTMLRFVRGNVN